MTDPSDAINLFDHFQKMARGEIPVPPIAQLLGLTLIAVERGRAVVEMEVTGKHTNYIGDLHGGVICEIVDGAMAVAYGSTLEEGAGFTTLQLSFNFVKSVRNGRIRAVGKVVKTGKTLGFVQCEVLDEEKNLVAWATGTCMTLNR